MDSELVLRPARAADDAFLYRMLALAASMDESDESVGAARIDPMLFPYVAGFGRDGDLGIIAERDGAPIGAVWVRLQHGEPVASKLWTPEVPELAIATVSGARGQGVGEALLRALIDGARGLYPAIVLSVREENPAGRLYARCGFVVERRIVNRVGTASLAMRLTLD